MSYPRYRQDEEDLLGVVYLRLDRVRRRRRNPLGGILSSGSLSPSQSRALAGYCRRILVNWARDVHRAERPWERFDERRHSLRVAAAPPGCRSVDPARQAEFDEMVERLCETLWRRVPRRAARLVEWLAGGGDVALARTLGLSRSTLCRDRRMLRRVLESMGWELPG